MSFTIDQKIIFAVRGRNLELVKQRLSEGGDVNYQDKKYGSALSEAIQVGDECLIQYLISVGANVNAASLNGVVPLEMALHHASDEIVRLLSWSGAKLGSKCRPHWKDRLEKCHENY